MDSIHEVSIPVGSLSIIGMKGCEEMAAKVDAYLSEWAGSKTWRTDEGRRFYWILP